MILSASRRTDISCFYGEWLVNRLKAGYVLVRNPMNPAQISCIPLSPGVVDAIVFWTKDAKNLMPRLPEIDGRGYPYYFQFTLTPYDGTVEKNLRDKKEIADTFIELSRRIGKERVLWRYDPIVVNDSLPVSYHKEQFVRLCEKLHEYTPSVTISFVDAYAKLKKLPTGLVRPVTSDEMAELGEFIGRTAKEYELTAKACCEKADLTAYGIGRASCIDKEVLEKVCGCPLDIHADRNQRKGCGCMESVDIGDYNTCANGCVYCYANVSPALAQKRLMSHDPHGELLYGWAAEEEKITGRKVQSYRREQTTLF